MPVAEFEPSSLLQLKRNKKERDSSFFTIIGFTSKVMKI
jgi:hypothetical protein